MKILQAETIPSGARPDKPLLFEQALKAKGLVPPEPSEPAAPAEPADTVDALLRKARGRASQVPAGQPAYDLARELAREVVKKSDEPLTQAEAFDGVVTAVPGLYTRYLDGPRRLPEPATAQKAGGDSYDHPAWLEITGIADDLQKADPDLDRAAAIAKAAETPEGAAAYARYRRR